MAVRESAVLNAGALAGELGAVFAVGLFGWAMHVLAAPTVLGIPLGYGFALYVATYLLWIGSGALLNTGVTLAKAMAWVSGIHYRNYFGPATLWFDVAMWAAYTAVQMGGAVLAMLALHHIFQGTGLLDTLPLGKPTGYLAGRQGETLLLLWLLNTFFITAFLLASAPRVGPVIKISASPLAIGLAYLGVVAVSVLAGTGSVCNFALDMAVALLAPGHDAKHLWISAVGQITGAATAFAIAYLAAIRDNVMHRRVVVEGARHYDHDRVNTLWPMMHLAADMLPVTAGVPPQHHHHHHSHAEPLLDATNSAVRAAHSSF